MESIASENFIKTLYHFHHVQGKDTKPGSIARELGISSSAATDMARKLSLKKLIQYEKYKALKLTPTGEKMALNILRKHRLWETFLHQVLGLSMHEIHREAELLEHQTSDFLAEKISLYLGNPEKDPHGDPIPNAKGWVNNNDGSIPLAMAHVNHHYFISRLSGSDKEFFDFCHSSHLIIGSLIRVNKHYTINQMIEIEVNNTRLILNKVFAQMIHVKREKE